MAGDAPSRRRQTVLIGGLGVVVLLLSATVVYLLTSGGDVETGATTTTTAAAPTTTLPPPTTTTTQPTTTTTLPPARVFTFAAVADTTVDNTSPGVSLGNRPRLTADGSDEPRRALIAFDVEGLPADLSHMSASLRLTVVDSSDAPGLVSFVAGGWDEGTNWDTAPPVGDPLAAIPVRPEGSAVEMDVTEAIVGDGRVEFYITIDSTDDVGFASREAGTAEPVLIISVGAIATGPPPLLIGAGDIASCEGEGDEATANLVQSIVGERQDAVVFTLGDSVYESGTLQAYQDCYEPSWGRFRDITRPAVGSRDYQVTQAADYFEYFGSRAGNEGEGYYSFSHGSWVVFVLNSNCSSVGGCGPGSPQYEWLVSGLESTESLCAAAYWQRPVYSSGVEGTYQDMTEIFSAAANGGLDVLLNGNDHIYERFAPRSAGGDALEVGVRQFTVGTGGRSLDEFGSIDTLSELTYNDSFGVLVLELFNGSYGWTFLSVDDGTVDTGNAACH